MKSRKSELTALITKASEKLGVARLMFENACYDDAVSRAYYAVFHSLTAALLSKGLSFSSHGQVIGAFNREFIKTNVFPKEFSAVIQTLFDDRQIGDYGIFIKTKKNTALDHLDKAEQLVTAIREFLKIKIKKHQ